MVSADSAPAGLRIGTTRPVRLFGCAAIVRPIVALGRRPVRERSFTFRRRRGGWWCAVVEQARSVAVQDAPDEALCGCGRDRRIGRNLRHCGASAISVFPCEIGRPALERSNSCFYSASCRSC